MIRAVALSADPPVSPELTAVEVGPLSVWTRQVEGPTAQAALVDADLLAAELRAGASPLPVHSSVRYQDASALVADVESRLDELVLALQLVHDHVEIAVRVCRTGPEEPPATTGTEHLQRLAASRRRRGEIARRLAASLGPLVRAVQPLDRPGTESWRGAALVRRSGLPDVPACMASFERGLGSGAKVSCTGPWPAWSFGPDGGAERLMPRPAAARAAW